jgi:hypothetical protein
MLEKHEVIIGARGRHGVPYTGERLLVVVRAERHVERPDVVGRADGRTVASGGASASCRRAAWSRPVPECSINIDTTYSVAMI